MSFNWINAEDYTMETFLFFDRWVIDFIMSDNSHNHHYNDGNRDYKADMGKALYFYPYVVRFCKAKAPECTAFLDEVMSMVPEGITKEEARKAETSILDYHDSFVVYAYPKVMDKVNYIRNWSPERLYEMVELEDKLVLDIGAGTGRLSFAAASRAKRVYASEPCDMLREYMRDRIKEKGITNMKVLDGIVTDLPFEDNTFDVVMSGQVVGDSYDEEIMEMTRVTKNEGWIIICNGDDEFKRTAPDRELIDRGFEWFRHESIEGGIIYNYRKKVIK